MTKTEPCLDLRGSSARVPVSATSNNHPHSQQPQENPRPTQQHYDDDDSHHHLSPTNPSNTLGVGGGAPSRHLFGRWRRNQPRHGPKTTSENNNATPSTLASLDVHVQVAEQIGPDATYSPTIETVIRPQDPIPVPPTTSATKENSPLGPQSSPQSVIIEKALGGPSTDSSSPASDHWPSDMPPEATTASTSSLAPHASDSLDPAEDGTKRALFRRPRAGSSTRQLELAEEDAHDFPDFRRVDQESSSNTIVWRSLPGQHLSVRSMDYRQSKRKVPSPGTLYDCVKVDFVESPTRLAHMSSRVELPAVPAYDDGMTRTWHAPDIFVVTLSLPRDHQAGKDDGPSYTISMYFTIKPETRRTLARLYAPSNSVTPPEQPQDGESPMVPAIRLFNEWCRRSPTESQFQGRFKLIAQAQNAQDLNLPSWISHWNGKPVLIKRSGKTGFLYQEDNCMEFEISFHPFPWAAKQAIQYLRQHLFHRLLLTLGFVIEGRDESELPESLLGLCQLCFPRPEHAISCEEFFRPDHGNPSGKHRHDQNDDGAR